MAVKSSSTKDVLAAFQKQHGVAVGSFGGALIDMVRLPTGIFTFDLASGGGFPAARRR